MRYSKTAKDHVRELRRAGKSLKQIQALTKVPITTIRSWILDIQLRVEQKEFLLNRAFEALQRGRIKAAILQSERRIKKEKWLLAKGKNDINKLTSREFFIAGVALYWAEGFKNKHEHRLGFCNSDPYMIRFYIKWLEEALGVSKKAITARLTINASYKEKSYDIEKYWSSITGIPLDQFTKTLYQQSQWKKQYKNTNYYGVLRIHVRESLDQLLTMRGWIQGLYLILNEEENK